MAGNENPPVGKRAPNFRLQIPGDDELKKLIRENLQVVREHLIQRLSKPVVNNGILMKELLDFWIKHHGMETDSTTAHDFPPHYIRVPKCKLNQQCFITAETSLEGFSRPIPHCAGEN